MTENLCAICGIEKATTRDHIPPKSIFPKPRPDYLITVPACDKCNNIASKDDESFRVFLSMHVGSESPKTKMLWKQGTLPSVRQNRRLFNSIVQKAKKIELRTNTGIILGYAMAVPWDSGVHNRTIERIIRGLYFYHFKMILGNQVIVKVQYFQNLSEEIFEMSREWGQVSVGNNAFIYRYGRVENDPLYSFWLFQFYEKHWASGYTEPVTPKKDIVTG